MKHPNKESTSIFLEPANLKPGEVFCPFIWGRDGTRLRGLWVKKRSPLPAQERRGWENMELSGSPSDMQNRISAAYYPTGGGRPAMGRGCLPLFAAQGENEPEAVGMVKAIPLVTPEACCLPRAKDRAGQRSP